MTPSSLLRSASFLLAGNLWTAVCNAAASLLLARAFAPADYGILQWLLWIQQAVSLAAAFGMPAALQQRIGAMRGGGRDAVRDLVRRCALLALPASALALAAVLALERAGILHMPEGGRTSWLLLALLGCPALVLRSLFAAAAIGAERTPELLKRVAWTAPVSLALLASLIPFGIGGALIGLGAWGLLEAGVFGALLGSALPPGGAVEAADLRAFLRSSAWLGATVILDLFSWQKVEVFLLGCCGRPDETGHYALAATLALQGTGILAASMGGILLARFSFHRERFDDASVQAEFSSSFLAVALVALPAASALAFLADPLLGLLSRPAWAPAFALLPWLAWGGANTALLAIVSSLLNSRSLTSFLFASSGIQMAVKLGIGPWLIRRWGAEGAAWMNAGVHALAFLAFAAAAHGLCKVRIPWRKLAGLLVCALLAALVLRTVPFPRVALLAYLPLYVLVVRLAGLLPSRRIS